MSFIVEGKNSWPELVGEDGEKAAKIIEEENPKVYTVLIPYDQKAVTSDFVNNRVRVFLDKDGKVERTPVIGKKTLAVLVGDGLKTMDIFKDQATRVIERKDGVNSQTILLDRIKVLIDKYSKVERKP